MDLVELKKRPFLEPNHKLHTQYVKFYELLDEVNKLQLSPHIKAEINEHIRIINSCEDTYSVLERRIFTTKNDICKLLEEEVNLVPKNYYRNMWMALGMATFGIPLGLIFAYTIGNMAFMGIGLPIGMSLGMAFGAKKDQEAANEGRQLQIEF